MQAFNQLFFEIAEKNMKTSSGNQVGNLLFKEGEHSEILRKSCRNPVLFRQFSYGFLYQNKLFWFGFPKDFFPFSKEFFWFS